VSLSDTEFGMLTIIPSPRPDVYKCRSRCGNVFDLYIQTTRPSDRRRGGDLAMRFSRHRGVSPTLYMGLNRDRFRGFLQQGGSEAFSQGRSKYGGDQH
jgi:hypothetical protein